MFCTKYKLIVLFLYILYEIYRLVCYYYVLCVLCIVRNISWYFSSTYLYVLYEIYRLVCTGSILSWATAKPRGFICLCFSFIIQPLPQNYLHRKNIEKHLMYKYSWSRVSKSRRKLHQICKGGLILNRPPPLQPPRRCDGT